MIWLANAIIDYKGGVSRILILGEMKFLVLILICAYAFYSHPAFWVWFILEDPMTYLLH